MNTMNKTTVIHHSADYDGIFCREIARKFLPDSELIGWDFPDKPLNLPMVMSNSDTVYILDLPVDRPFGLDFRNPSVRPDWMAEAIRPDAELWKPLLPRIVWIDHHNSSIASHPSILPGYRIDGVAACRLAWQWFLKRVASSIPVTPEHLKEVQDIINTTLPTKQDYLDRNVSEPLAILLAGEYDVWDCRPCDLEIGL